MRCTKGALARLSFLLFLLSFIAHPHAALQVDVLRSVGGLPAHVAGLFEEPAAFQQAANGYYFVFDRRGHAVYIVDPDRANARRIVEVGQEEGKIIQPGGFDMAADGSFVVADVPRGQERIQIFGPGALRTGGFFIAGTRGAAGHPRQLRGHRHLVAAVFRRLGVRQRARARLADHRVLGLRHRAANDRAAAEHRIRAGARPAPGDERRPPAHRSDRRVLLRLPHRPADVPQVRRGRHARSSSATSKDGRSTISSRRSRPGGRRGASRTAKCRSCSR